MKNTKHNSASF